MCSSSKCDMPGLIGGPVGNLVGIGIKALLNGAPIGPRSAEAMKKPTDKENIKQFYDNVEAHLKGALQILQPAMEIKKILVGECKSAGPERSALTPATPIVYYSPQNQPKSQRNVCPSRCCGVKKSSTEKSSKASISRSDKSTAEITGQPSYSSTSNKCSKNIAAKKCSPCLAGDTTGNSSSSSRYESKGKISKASTNKSSKSRKAQCCICNVSLKDNSMLAVLPCEHLFCYTCLAKAKVPRCQKCEKSFDMKNVSQIYVTA